MAGRQPEAPADRAAGRGTKTPDSGPKPQIAEGFQLHRGMVGKGKHKLSHTRPQGGGGLKKKFKLKLSLKWKVKLYLIIT